MPHKKSQPLQRNQTPCTQKKTQNSTKTGGFACCFFYFFRCFLESLSFLLLPLACGIRLRQAQPLFFHTQRTFSLPSLLLRWLSLWLLCPDLWRVDRCRCRCDSDSDASVSLCRGVFFGAGGRAPIATMAATLPERH